MRGGAGDNDQLSGVMACSYSPFLFSLSFMLSGTTGANPVVNVLIIGPNNKDCASNLSVVC